MSKLKNVSLSLLSFLVIEALFCAFLVVESLVTDRSAIYFQGVLQMFVYFAMMLLVFSFPAWFVALPAILFFTDLRAWRFWVLLALGAALGPLVLCCEFIYLHRAGTSGDQSMLSIATGLSGCSTLVYLLLLRRSQAVTPTRN